MMTRSGAITLPQASRARVLQRVGSIWHPQGAPHHLVYGMTGSGKTTVIKELLGLCEHERVLICDPKPSADPIWDDPAGPHRWGRPVTAIDPMFGYDGQPGGGPQGMWYRLTGTPDRAATSRRLGEALDIVEAEGHVVLVLDDVREICRQLRLAEQVDSILNLGRSASVLAVLSATETSYVAGRSQGGLVWVGHTSGYDAAKAGAQLLGHTGRAWCETTAAIPEHGWIFSESQAGNHGPVLIT
jgi:energy-coupling factor transporter ATP-binding protein EcfA2